jgi:hypothetical protein
VRERRSEPEGERDRVGKKEGGQERDKEKGEASRSPEHLLGGQAQAGGGVGNVQEQGTQLLGCLNEEDNRHFADTPLALGNFSREL